MSKIKKVLAMVMTLAMVMAMGMTSFAAPKETATITIDNAGDAVFAFVQVIKPDRTTETGWAFTSEEIADCYKTAFNLTDDQDVIKALIENNNISAKVEAALEAVTSLPEFAFGAMSNPQEVSSAGVYVIAGYEEGYTYNNMAAYVGFGEVKDDDGNIINEYPSLEDVTINAKKKKDDIDKSAEDEDKATQIGDTEIFHVTSEVPYFAESTTNRTYTLTDTLTGGEYVSEDTDADGNKLIRLTVKVGDDINIFYGKISADGKSFTADLSALVTTNANANLPIDIAYAVKVTATEVHNNASMGDFGSDSEDLYTGTITLTKWNEDKSEKLAGAGFQVTPADDVDPGFFAPLTFTQLTEGHYVLDPNGTVTEVFTGPDGTLIIDGLDVGTYNFKETTAPEGYHIKNDPSGVDASATLEVGKDGATAIFTAETELTNTKLSSLPGTGGIGTTIFTIGGCLIMIAAAALFFASRKKSEN